MTMMKKIVSLIMVALLVLSCQSCVMAAEDPGTTFVYARADSVTSFDLHAEITENNAFAIDKVFEPLVRFDASGNIVDWLAASHAISEDGLTYTFVLQNTGLAATAACQNP